MMFITREKVGFIENTAMRHRRGGRREVTVTSSHTDRKTKKDKERQKAAPTDWTLQWRRQDRVVRKVEACSLLG